MEAPPIIDTANAHAYFSVFLLFTHISCIYTYIVYIHKRQKYIKKMLLLKHVLVPNGRRVHMEYRLTNLTGVNLSRGMIRP